MFGSDFGDKIDHYATLIDPNHNEFEILIERINGMIFLTKGWQALRDFYDIDLGAWATMVFVGLGKFQISLKDRFGKQMNYPKFVLSMKFAIEKTTPLVVAVNVFQPHGTMILAISNIIMRKTYLQMMLILVFW